MTQDEMYNDIKTQIRSGVSNVQALFTTLKKVNVEFLDNSEKAYEHIYVRCDNIPIKSVEIIFWLTKTLDLKYKIVSCSKTITIENVTFTCNYPYLNIYK